VKCDGEKLGDINLEISLSREHVLQIGKRRFVRVGKKHEMGSRNG